MPTQFKQNIQELIESFNENDIVSWQLLFLLQYGLINNLEDIESNDLESFNQFCKRIYLQLQENIEQQNNVTQTISNNNYKTSLIAARFQTF